MKSSLLYTFFYISTTFLLVALLSTLTGYTLELLLITLTLILSWHLFNLYRLVCWLEKDYNLVLPDSITVGLWGKAVNKISSLQKHNRKRKRKLTNLLNRFRTSTQAMPDATVVLNSRYKIEWLNRAATRLLGLKACCDTGKLLPRLIHNPIFHEYLQSPPETLRDTIEMPSPCNPDKMLQVQLVPYGGNKHLLIARDVTKLHRLKQIRQDFVANVSHELRTPLTVLHGFIETFQDEFSAQQQSPACQELTQEWQQPLELMVQQSLRMQNIINDLLVLSRLESEVPNEQSVPVAVTQLLENLHLEAIALSGGQQHQLSLESVPDLQVYGQADELNSAFGNLIFNAVRYTPAQGKIHIRWFWDDDGAHMSVTDSGEGIASEHLPRLTERFYRVDVGRSRNQGGTGLGLAIVKHVLNRHCAHLEIQSQVAQGSCFCCNFPVKMIVL
ncbi:phosphate regulon sensor histidine kinase PhoR [Candidatus Venteria ishoeyi]|uniref:phosphate regulon sensor histidine kinase PhoR n=1 Tax=Candidatus Venteria ishoeyi TaxID=1899563 RepID=UPI0025A685AA|nr:phosphate regulon sensor histidine kinase PhoR [Candidatus Venteria ishoeyi]MDM8546645.1 phosphate regulon sensor histidine kinase PhoR [Candidatus Venteria ishoeyi]